MAISANKKFQCQCGTEFEFPHDSETLKALGDHFNVCAGLKQASEKTAVSGTEARVCADIAARQKLGTAKYGITVENNPLPLRAWLQHAYEEGLDQVIYLRRAMDEMDKYP